jgi:hypothetical protein
MNGLFRFFLAISSTSLFIVIFLIKSKYYIFESNFYFYLDNFFKINNIEQYSLVGFISIPLLFLAISMKLLEKLSKDRIKEGEIIEIENSTNNFLPSYLGYFFVALSISDNDFLTMSIIYFIIVLFVFYSQTNYFNPFLLILGYKFYKIKTNRGLSLLLISKKEFKKSNEVIIEKVYRINNSTYIDTQKSEV